MISWGKRGLHAENEATPPRRVPLRPTISRKSASTRTDACSFRATQVARHSGEVHVAARREVSASTTRPVLRHRPDRWRRAPTSGRRWGRSSISERAAVAAATATASGDIRSARSLARERAIGAVLAVLVDTCAKGLALLPDPDAIRAHRGYNPTRHGLGVVCFWRVASGRTRI